MFTNAGTNTHTRSLAPDKWILLALTLITRWVCIHTRMPHTHTHCQEHIVQRDEGELTSSDTSLLSALYPLSQTPKIKRQRKRKKQRTLPTKKSLFMRYYHSYRTKPWMWPSPMRTVKGQKNVETRVHNSYLNGLKKKKNHCRSTFVSSPKARPPLCMLCRPPNIVTAFAQFFFLLYNCTHCWTTRLQRSVQHLYQWHQHSQYHSYQKQAFCTEPFTSIYSSSSCLGFVIFGRATETKRGEEATVQLKFTLISLSLRNKAYSRL